MNSLALSTSLILEDLPTTPNDIYLKKIYYYYYKKGYKNIITESITNLLINYFLIFFINFISNCIDYEGLISINSNDHHSHSFLDYVSIGNWFPKNPYLVICFLIYIFYLICLTIQTYFEIESAKKMRDVYLKFEINDNNIKEIEWEEIMNHIIQSYSDPNLNHYTIISRILRNENIIISIMRSNKIDITSLSQIIEWNFIFCFINFINHFTEYNQTLYNQSVFFKYKEKIKTRIKIVGFINLLSLPFAIFIILIYNLIKHGETFYYNPQLICHRDIDINHQWILRYYNELPHQFEIRMKKSKKNIFQILKKRNNTYYSVIIRFLIFLASSVVLLIIILSLINENILTKCYLFYNKPLIWVLTLVGTFIIFARKSINNFGELTGGDGASDQKTELKEYYKNLQELNLGIHPDNINIQFIKKIYNFQVYYMIKEILLLIKSPFILYQWYLNSDQMADSILNLLEEHFSVGYISYKSRITNLDLIKSEPHTYASFINFLKKYPSLKNIIGFDIENIENSGSFDWSSYEVNYTLRNESLLSIYSPFSESVSLLNNEAYL